MEACEFQANRMAFKTKDREVSTLCYRCLVTFFTSVKSARADARQGSVNLVIKMLDFTILGVAGPSLC